MADERTPEKPRLLQDTPGRISRREAVRNATLAGIAIWPGGAGSALARSLSPNSRLNIAAIGCGGRGALNLDAIAPSENIVALCDVDEARAAKTFQRFAGVPRFHDFRVMLDRMHREIDAVIVSTPDHCHAAASIRAMKMGKHVYCEKPLTWSVHEARRMREVAAETRVATQMGNQGTAADTFRNGIEVLRAGAVGTIREAHIWTNRPGDWWKQGLQRPKEKPPVPSTLKWDLWLGPAPKRPYSPAYVPHDWRGWVDFGTGPLGDMGCHTINQTFWALNLEDPVSVDVESSLFNGDSYPLWSVIRWNFSARGDLPPLTLTWYDGWQTGGRRPPEDLLGGEPLGPSGVLLIGEKGKFFSDDDFGRRWSLLPKARFRDYQPPEPQLPRSPGHHLEWLQACKGGAPAMASFDRASRLTEVVLLGIVALRAGGSIEWDAAGMRVTNNARANRFLRRDPRRGWDV